jgi:hypothetical protein
MGRKEQRMAKGRVITHNHPTRETCKQKYHGKIPEGSELWKGVSLSAEDVEMACKIGAKEIRAVTPNYTYSFSKADGSNLSPFDWDEMLEDFEESTMNAVDEIQQHIDEGGTDYRIFRTSRGGLVSIDRDIFNDAWTGVAELSNGKYIYKRVEHKD